MIKLVNFIFMVCSLIVIVSMVFSITNLLDSVGFFVGLDFDIDDLSYILKNSTTEEIMAVIAMLGSTIFILFGFPVTIFLISLNGLKD